MPKKTTADTKLAAIERATFRQIIEKEGLAGVAERLHIAPGTLARAVAGMSARRITIEALRRGLAEVK